MADEGIAPVKVRLEKKESDVEMDQRQLWLRTGMTAA
jgi:hypothetical protein